MVFDNFVTVIKNEFRVQEWEEEGAQPGSNQQGEI
jgi:hypothetical protein